MSHGKISRWRRKPINRRKTKSTLAQNVLTNLPYLFFQFIYLRVLTEKKVEIRIARSPTPYKFITTVRSLVTRRKNSEFVFIPCFLESRALHGFLRAHAHNAFSRENRERNPRSVPVGKRRNIKAGVAPRYLQYVEDSLLLNVVVEKQKNTNRWKR